MLRRFVSVFIEKYNRADSTSASANVQHPGGRGPPNATFSGVTMPIVNNSFDMVGHRVPDLLHQRPPRYAPTPPPACIPAFNPPMTNSAVAEFNRS